MLIETFLFENMNPTLDARIHFRNIGNGLIPSSSISLGIADTHWQWLTGVLHRGLSPWELLGIGPRTFYVQSGSLEVEL